MLYKNVPVYTMFIREHQLFTKIEDGKCVAIAFFSGNEWIGLGDLSDTYGCELIKLDDEVKIITKIE